MREGKLAKECRRIGDSNPRLPGVSMAYDGECATLSFGGVAPSDAARYTCIATNKAGEARTSLRLVVKESADTSPDKRSGEAPRFAAWGMGDQEVRLEIVPFPIPVLERQGCYKGVTEILDSQTYEGGNPFLM